MEDIKRICLEPTEEDRTWFPQISGTGDWCDTLKDAWANYRDESFIRQYLSPHLIRKLKLFTLTDDARDNHCTVAAIHDERGYEKIRETLARSYDIGVMEPNIQIVDVDLRGDRRLCLEHSMRDEIPLEEQSRGDVIKYLRQLWGYDVRLVGIDDKSKEKVYEEPAVPNEAND